MSNHARIIADNLSRLRERIATAAESVGRDPAEILLVGVTKYVGAHEAAALLKAGCTALGESRPQQLWEKSTDSELTAAHWHMIGHLQRNKVRRTLPLVDLIHSVDSLRLAKAIDEEAERIDHIARVLLEVNCSGDDEKHGLTADELKSLLPQLADLTHLEVCGLMTMAAREGGEAVAAKNFESLRNLREDLMSICPSELELSELSMGMSHDFEVAIREGATLVRIGSTLFKGID